MKHLTMRDQRARALPLSSGSPALAITSLVLAFLVFLSRCEATMSSKTSAGPPRTRALTDAPSTEQMDTLEAAEDMWDSHSLTGYDYVFKQSGNMRYEATRSMTVSVRNNQVSSVTYESDGTTVPEDYAQHVPTVDGLFDRLADYAEKGVNTWEVAYDEEYGYPTLIKIDPDARIADEEVDIQASGLVAMMPVAAEVMPAKEDDPDEVTDEIVEPDPSSTLGSNSPAFMVGINMAFISVLLALCLSALI